ncbi:MAG: membrane integrity-associated transporter subunit PqiC [Candidatus Binatia bacterium]
MNPVRLQVNSLLPLFLCAVVLSACSLGKPPPPTRLYVLTALPPLTGGSGGKSPTGVAVGVGPVELPRYLSRPQIVTGESGNELQQAPFDQWAEPLDTNFTRVLAQNLSQMLATERVAVFPWKGAVPLDYQVVVEVTHFLGVPNGTVSLVALWRVLGKDGKQSLVSRESRITESTGSADYAALAAAMSRTVAALSRDITATITDLARQGAAHP